MKTIKIKFSSKYAEQVGILLNSIELKILMTWSEEGFLDDTCIYCVLKLNREDSTITPIFQLEKIRERNYIKIIS